MENKWTDNDPNLIFCSDSFMFYISFHIFYNGNEILHDQLYLYLQQNINPYQAEVSGATIDRGGGIFE